MDGFAFVLILVFKKCENNGSSLYTVCLFHIIAILIVFQLDHYLREKKPCQCKLFGQKIESFVEKVTYLEKKEKKKRKREHSNGNGLLSSDRLLRIDSSYWEVNCFRMSGETSFQFLVGTVGNVFVAGRKTKKKE